MALDKAIRSGKEHRKPYRRAGKYDRTCRPGGSCPFCRRARMKHDIRNDLNAREQLGEEK